MNKTVQTVFAVVCAFFIFGMFAYAIDTATKLPDVHYSYATNECVKVINYVAEDNYDCQNLPPKFYHVWVQ